MPPMHVPCAPARRAHAVCVSGCRISDERRSLRSTVRSVLKKKQKEFSRAEEAIRKNNRGGGTSTAKQESLLSFIVGKDKKVKKVLSIASELAKVFIDEGLVHHIDEDVTPDSYGSELASAQGAATILNYIGVKYTKSGVANRALGEQQMCKAARQLQGLIKKLRNLIGPLMEGLTNLELW